MAVERVFLPSGEAGVQLEMVIARPKGAGPHPALIFNHGSTGRGTNPSLYTRTIRPAVLADHFVARGWMVLFPQRRGRGKSGGVYGEGLAADGSGYSCDPAIAIAGFERAVEDLDAVVRHLGDRSDVDRARLLIGGVSRGGILAVGYAGMRPGLFRGVVNFNGGWLGRGCASHETVNPLLFERGAAAGVPMLWLHGSQDPYYRIGHCRGNFARFLAAGGRGRFIAARAGHGLLFKPPLWSGAMDGYLAELASGP